MNKLNIDIDHAAMFQNFLDKDRKIWTYQTFDDNADRKDKKLARVLNGTLNQHSDELTWLNQQGAGIFVTINRTDGTGRKLSNITDVRAAWIEDDDGQLQMPLEPHISVESSPGKYHHYFLLADASHNDFSKIQEELVNNWGSDPNAKDMSRVLRLPGFYHQKVSFKKGQTGEPWLVHMVGGLAHAG